MQLQIEQWPVDRLIPYIRNARTHSDAQVAQVAGSIAEFGFVNPILVGPDGVIVAGHARLAAARILKLTEVPVIVLAHLSETQRRALVLADNKLAENAGWDEEMLRVELESLQEDGFSLELVGFSDEELEALLRDPEQVAAGLTDEDAAPEVPETAVTVPGDVWLLGPHRLLCGDATQIGRVEKVHGRRAGGHGLFRSTVWRELWRDDEGQVPREVHRKIANDNLGDAFEKFLYDACVNLLTVAKGAVYICMSSSELHTLEKAFREAGGHWSTFVIWAKNTFTMGRSDYQRQYEPILYGWKEGTDHFWCGARDQGDVWFIKKPVSNDLHPTMKPVELVERALRNSSKTRDTVLDPFGGSGTTMIACERTGRQARLIEMEPRYCDVVIRRWQEHAGQLATLEADGRLFKEMAAERLGIAA